MEQFLAKVAEINGSINGVVWGIFGLALLIGTGIIVTISTKFFQVSHVALWWKNTIGSLFSKDVFSSIPRGRELFSTIRVFSDFPITEKPAPAL